MNKIRDIDLMQLADDELTSAEREGVEAAVAADAGARARLDGVVEIGEVVRTHLERAADDAEPRLAALWSAIDREIDKHAALDREPAPRAADPADAPRGVWSRFTRWLDAYRGHILTGTLSAGAVAAIVLVLRPAGDHAAPVTPPVARAGSASAVDDGSHGPAVPVPDGAGDPRVVPVVHTPAEVESLDVDGGTGTVFTVKDEDGEETTVIWVTPDDTLEGI
ncbi:MAG: hypothetical protein H6708_16995 [Kofleriaceae bacterium]|nr:hypothetical protein [Myxococcales bacterium]MCB9562103.1 hypothetical protein [Kofleriaceae bacterium]